MKTGLRRHGYCKGMKAVSATLDYHLKELAISLDENDPRHSLPVAGDAQRVLDVGCGAGQSLVGMCPQQAYGIDTDLRALQLGRNVAERVRFAAASGEQLPFADASFDLVFSRVALPYMHVPSAVREIRRVLAPGGRIWLALHPASLWWRDFRAASLKRKVYLAYGGLLSAIFNATGFFPRLPLPCETFQTARRMRKLLMKLGFFNVSVTRGRHFIITGELLNLDSLQSRPPEIR